MAKRFLKIEVSRDAYAPEDVSTMTVGELADLLGHFDRDLPIILSHDRGYTYGGIDEFEFEISDFEEEEEEEEEDWEDED